MDITRAEPDIRLSNRGFSMIELMVSVVISILLLAAVSMVYLSSKQTFSTSNNVARVQENSRFALHFIDQDLRMAGYAGCASASSINNLLDPDGTGYDPNFYEPTEVVGGWEFNGTAPGDVYTLTTLNPSSVSATSWVGLGTGLALPTDLTGLNMVPGSDVLVVKRSDTQLEVRPQGPVLPPATTFLINDARSGSIPSIGQSRLLVISNCQAADLIQNSQDTDSTPSIGREVSGSGNPGNITPSSTDKFSNTYDIAADIYAFTSHAYFVATGMSGEPSLFRLSFSNGQPGAGEEQELVDGVENMQVLYGEDTDGDGVANKYIAADDVTDPTAIVAVRVGLLMRATTQNEDFIDESTKQFFVADNIEIKPVVDPNHLRYIASSTVQLRNLGL